MPRHTHTHTQRERGVVYDGGRACGCGGGGILSDEKAGHIGDCQPVRRGETLSTCTESSEANTGDAVISEQLSSSSGMEDAYCGGIQGAHA